jgi:hypothetical protein
MNWLTKFIFANWNYLMGGLVLLMVFICGVQIGESRINREWNAEKLRVALVVAKQEQRAADIRQSQTQINQGISNDYAKNSKVLASRHPVSRLIGVCDCAAVSGNSVPAVSDAAQGAAVPATYALFASDADARGVSCEQLEKDAAQTTLMLLEVQRWYQKQSALSQ